MDESARTGRLAAGTLLVALFFFGFAQEAAAEGDWKEDWAKTLERAKKEGRLVVHAGPGDGPLYQAFQNKFPEIKVSYIAGHGGERSQRIMSERRAGQYLADLYVGGSATMQDVLLKGKILDPVKPLLILPEVVDESKWWGGKHIYIDNESQYIISFNGITQSYFHHNAKLVDPKEFRSYWDFLNPKWKGKFVTWEPMASGTDGALRFLYHHPDIGPQFVRRFLTEMDLTPTRDARQFVDWLATGRFLLAGLQSADRSNLYEAKNQGLPVSWFDSRTFKEGAPLSTSSGNLVLMNRAPHPNAAKVFINWLLSRDGQITYQKTSGDVDSLRTDIPKEGVPPHIRRTAGVKYVFLTDPAYSDLNSVRNFVTDIWKKRK